MKYPILKQTFLKLDKGKYINIKPRKPVRKSSEGEKKKPPSQISKAKITINDQTVKTVAEAAKTAYNNHGSKDIETSSDLVQFYDQLRKLTEFLR